MRKILVSECKNERQNQRALGLFNASVSDPSNLHNSLSDFIEKNGYDTEINRSKTNFGESDYIYVGKILKGEHFLRKENAIKIRISDHSVTNHDRVFGEYHISKGQSLEMVKEGVINHLNYQFNRSNFFFKRNKEVKAIKRFERPVMKDGDKLISKRINSKGTKTLYTFDRTLTNVIEEWVNKKTKKVYQPY